jgi:hypothetical protein
LLPAVDLRLSRLGSLGLCPSPHGPEFQHEQEHEHDRQRDRQASQKPFPQPSPHVAFHAVTLPTDTGPEEDDFQNAVREQPSAVPVMGGQFRWEEGQGEGRVRSLSPLEPHPAQKVSEPDFKRRIVSPPRHQATKTYSFLVPSSLCGENPLAFGSVRSRRVGQVRRSRARAHQSLSKKKKRCACGRDGLVTPYEF